MRVYRHSGAVPATGAIMALAGGALTAAALGIIYSFTFYYIPYVYLNFLMAMGVGAGTGYVVGLCAREGKIRNVPAVGAIGFVAVLAGIYTEWGSTWYALCPIPELPEFWNKVGLGTFHPLAIAALMLKLFAEGSWGLSANTTVHGWPLVALWVIEAGLIITLSIIAAVGQIADRPFCEACQRWASSHTPHFYVGNGSEPVWSEVQEGTFETLAMTSRASGKEHTYVRLTINTCDGCSGSNFLTITACKNTIDSKGNPKLEEKNLVTNLILEPAQVDIIQAANMIAPAAGDELPAMLAGGNDWTLQKPSEPKNELPTEANV